MMRNNLWRTFGLTLLVVAGLLGLSYLPKIKVFDTELRRVNMLSDVQPHHKDREPWEETAVCALADTAEQDIDPAAVGMEKKAYTDSVPVGMTPIEDLAQEGGREMDNFYAALDKAAERPVRIAYFGDSYIEGDILTMDLRALLQQRFGGRGVGFLEIESVTSGFRQTAITKRNGWKAHHANDVGDKTFKSSLQSMAGSYFIPEASATYEAQGSKRLYADQLGTAEVATVYFTPCDGLHIDYALNGGERLPLFVSDASPVEPSAQDETTAEADTIETEADSQQTSQPALSANRLMAKTVSGSISKFDMTITGGESSLFYGVALDGHRGISLDNFSMRGSNGLYLRNVPQETLNRLAALRPYDLIILHYGLNVASPQQTDYSSYALQMGKVVRRLKEAYPQASLLIVSIADRDARDEDGEMHTMQGVRELVAAQRKMASSQQVAFWNLYQAMGGNGSLSRMTEKGQANKDYTHINAAGGRHLAKLLFDVLINGKENYDNRNR